MALVIDLPAPLEEDLAAEAAREGVSPSEQAAFWLQLMAALARVGRNISSRDVVEVHDPGDLLEPAHAAEIYAKLKAICPRHQFLARELPPSDRPPPRPERADRVSALGKFAHLGLSTGAFIAEKRLETDREDRDR